MKVLGSGSFDSEHIFLRFLSCFEWLGIETGVEVSDGAGNILSGQVFFVFEELSHKIEIGANHVSATFDVMKCFTQ